MEARVCDLFKVLWGQICSDCDFLKKNGIQYRLNTKYSYRIRRVCAVKYIWGLVVSLLTEEAVEIFFCCSIFLLVS